MSLFFLGIGINILVILILYLRLRGRKRDLFPGGDPLEDIRQDVESLIVEINQITDRNVSLIEDRIKQLTSLIDDADKRITLLKRETDRPAVSFPRYNKIAKKTLPDVKQVRTEQKQGKREQVIELHKKGFAPGIIAAKVGSSIGEVELIISLASGKEERQV